MKSFSDGPQVVLVGHAHDEHSDYLAKLLCDRGRVNVLRVALDQLPETGMAWDPVRGLRSDGHRTTRRPGGLLRRWGMPSLGQFDEAYHDFMETECRDFLRGALESSDVEWITSPSAILRAELKLVQLRAAQQRGVPIPATLVTNDADEACEFARAVGPVVAKAVRYALVTTNPEPRMAWTTTQSEGTLKELRGSPIIIQEQIEADLHLRVITVGEDVFVSGVPSRDIDWRKDLGNHDRFEAIPSERYPEVEHLARTIAHELHLGFSAQDWIATKTGRTVFLEANPSGQWLFLEPIHRGRIGGALIQELERLAEVNQ